MTDALAQAAAPPPTHEDDPTSDPAFARVVRALVDRARGYMDTEVRPRVRKAWRYREGDVDFDPAQRTDMRRSDGTTIYEGSSVVMTEVEDTIDQLLPELARVFLGSDEPVHFDPQGEGDEEGAKQATDYCTHVWLVENDGEARTLTAFDLWLHKFLALKVWWESDESTVAERFEGLSDQQVQMLQMAAQGGWDGIVGLEADPSVIALPVPQPMPDGGVLWAAQPAQSWAGVIHRKKSAGRICVDLIPHEEFLIDGDASATDKARLVGHDTYKLVSEVVALGVPLETARRYKGTTPGAWASSGRTSERRGAQPYDVPGDDSLEWVRVVEAVVLHDRDGDGIAERYRVLALGDKPEVVAAFEDDSVGFVVASPYEVPFRPIGRGVPERTFDLQDMSTSTVRSIYDNFRRAINPREIVTGDDNTAYQDLTSWFPGPIRADRVDNIAVHAIPFVGGQMFPLLDLVNNRLATRTGISAAGAGLDANALKGQTLEASHEILTAPQSRTEFLVRRYAIGVMRPLFKEILRLSVKYQDRAKTIRLRDKFITVDPRSWNAAMDVRPRVGLGTGTRAERMVGLNLIAQKQEQMIYNPAFGPSGPLVDLALLRNTYVAMAELAGEKEAGRYFHEMDDQKLAAFAQQQQQGAQQQKAEALQSALQLEQGKAAAHAQGRAQVAVVGAQAKAGLGAQQTQAKAGADVQKAVMIEQLQQQTDAHKAQLAADTQTRIAQLEAALEQQKMQLQMVLKTRELAMEADLERQKMANRERSGQGNIPSVVG